MTWLYTCYRLHVRRKGLKPSSVAAKQVRDQIEKISKEAVGKKREMRSPSKDKGNDKVEEVTKKSTSSLLLEKVGQW